MKKSNVILFVIAALLSAFLLGLWYYLGLNHVDEPLDLVVSVIWWIAMVAMIAGIVKTENTRKRKVRTAYVGAGFLFNSETGNVPTAGRSVVDVLEEVLTGLEYGFEANEADDATKAAIKAVVRSETFKPADQDGKEPEEWTGEVVPAVPGAKGTPFANKVELAALLAAF